MTPIIRVVERSHRLTSSGIYDSSHYTYGNFRTHRRGLGSLGFRILEITNETTGIRTVTTYSQDWQKRTTGMVESSQTIAPDGTILSESYNDLDNRFDGIYTDRYLPYIKASTGIQRDLDGSFIKTVTTEKVLDDRGWKIQSRRCITADEVFVSNIEILPCNLMPNKDIDKYTQIEYYDESDYPEYPQKPYRMVTSTTIPTLPPFQPSTESRVVQYDYYADTGRIKSETVQPDSNNWMKKAYTYHASGQLETTTLSGPDFESRTNTVQFDSSNRPWRLINPLGHTEVISYNDARFPWLVTNQTSPNGVEIEYEYNSWGEKIKEINANGSWSSSEKLWCGEAPDCDPENGELFFVKRSSSNGADGYIFYDVLSRKVRTKTFGYRNGAVAPVVAKTRYNIQGLPVWKGHSFFEGDSEEIGEEITYDILGRVIAIKDAKDNVSTIVYSGNETLFVNQKGQQKRVVSNTLNQQIEVYDNNSNVITYEYDAFGNMVLMQGPLGTESRIGFDSRGFKTRLDDEDLGTWTYQYNSLGELTHQTDAKGQTTFTEYDLLGRTKSRTDLYGSTSAHTSNWYYDDTSVSTTAIGKLTLVTNNNDYAQTIKYDVYSRPYETVTLIDGFVYKNTTTYDELGRVKDAVYPNGYAVRNEYHPTLGILQRVINPTSNLEFWRVDSTNANGQVVNSTLGGQLVSVTNEYSPETGMINGIRAVSSLWGTQYQDMSYSWDSIGNLESFDDVKHSVSETYVYDSVNRLTDVLSTGGNSSVDYDILGNIINKSGVGSYSYQDIALPSECGTGASSPGPHAVRRITGPKTNFFCYDRNGNIVKDSDRIIEYTGYNKPSSIKRGSTEVYFEYGPDRKRFKRVDKKNSQITTSYYIGGYERIVGGSSVTHKISIGGSAQVISIDGSPGVDIQYFLKDHLGSVVGIINDAGMPIEQSSYDAWGNRRATSLILDANPLDYDNGITKRGFTGHEHIDSVGLIHMNGRVYDPVISRFLSPDPIIQAPGNLQSLNRYSYVWNNPLSKYDPSGYYSWDDFEDDLKDVVKWVEDAHRLYFDIAVFAGQRDNFREYVAEHSWAQDVLGAATKLCGPMEFACKAGLNYEIARGAGMSADEAREVAAIAGAISYIQMEFSNWVDATVDGEAYEFGSWTQSSPQYDPFDVDVTEMLKGSAKDVFTSSLKDAAKDAAWSVITEGGSFEDAFKESFSESFSAEGIAIKFMGAFTKGYGSRSFEGSMSKYLGSFSLASDIQAIKVSSGHLEVLGGYFSIGEGIYSAAEGAVIGLIFNGNPLDGALSGLKDWGGDQAGLWNEQVGEPWFRSTSFGGWAFDQIDTVKSYFKHS